MTLRSFVGTGALALLLLTGGGAATAQDAPDAVTAVIGAGTEASCTSNAAVNAFTTAVESGGTVTFNCGQDPVTINVNTSVVDTAVTVDGGGRIVLSGEDLRQHFLVMSSGNLTLNNISVNDGGGGGGSGGAISIAANGRVTINGSFLTSNQVESGANGGAIFTSGLLTITNSTLGANRADFPGNGGAIYMNGGTLLLRNVHLTNNQAQNGGAIFKSAAGTVTLDRTSFRANIASANGGGMHLSGNTGSILNSTFSDNRADQGGGIYKNGDLPVSYATFNENRADTGGAIHNVGGATTLSNSIFAGSRNEANTASSLNCDGPAMTSGGHNIISDGTCLPNPGGVGDLFNTEPLLGVYQLLPTRGYIPAANSPAVDYGLAICPALDQRGFPRPLGPACDVGAIERGSITYLPFVDR